MRDALVKLHLSVILAGFTGIFGKLITLSEGVLVWYRMLFASVIFFLILTFSHALRRLSKRDVVRISGVGFLLSLHWVFFYGSIKISNISIAVVCFSLVGVFSALFEPLIERRSFSKRELLLSGLSLLGVLFIFQFESRYRLGIALGVVSSALCALYTVLLRRVGDGLPSATVSFYVLAGGFLCLTAVMPFYLRFFPQEVLLPDGRNMIYLLLFALFCTIFLNVLQLQALKRVSAFTLNLTYNLEPVYSIALAMLFFDEAKELNFSFYVGLGLIVLSVALQMIDVWRKREMYVKLDNQQEE